MFTHTVTSPCYGCERRSDGCHSICEAYIDFRRICDAERAENNKRRRQANDLIAFTRASYERVIKSKGLQKK